MLDSECSIAVRDTSLCRQESEQVGSKDAQLCVSLVDSQERYRRLIFLVS